MRPALACWKCSTKENFDPRCRTVRLCQMRQILTINRVQNASAFSIARRSIVHTSPERQLPLAMRRWQGIACGPRIQSQIPLFEIHFCRSSPCA